MVVLPLGHQRGRPNTMRSRTQGEWWTLANSVKNVIYADNEVAPMGTPIATALMLWAHRLTGRKSRHTSDHEEALAEYMSTSKRRLDAGDIREAIAILKRHGY